MSTANKETYKPRMIDSRVEQYLIAVGAVCVEGPKWCGKTWTSSYHCNSEYLIGDPANNFQNRQLAEIALATVLEEATPHLIDEWQEVPSIWNAVRYAVDQRATSAQFILTGSSTPKRKGILHSGAGRISKLRMRTMSLYESGDSSGQVSIEELCRGELSPCLTGDADIKQLIYYVVRGGLPGNIDVSRENAHILPKSYISAILDDDIQRLDSIRYNKHKISLLLRSLARNESTTATNSRLLRDIQETDDEIIDRDTIATYLDVFDRLFLTDNLLPFS